MSQTITASVLSAFFITLGSSAYAQTGQSASSPATAASVGRSGPQQQSEDETRTLFDGATTIGWYGGAEVKGTPVLGTPSALVGGQGGVLLGHALLLGGAGYGLATIVDVPGSLQTPGASTRLQLGYGGVRIGWILFPRSVAHASIATLLGGGSVGWEENTGAFEIDDGVRTPDMTSRNDAFFVLEPELELEVNIHRAVRFAATGSYRWIHGVQTAALPNGDLSGPALGAVMKFGTF